MERSRTSSSCSAPGWLVAVVLLVVAGCDGSGTSNPTPSATFTASVSGDTSASLSGSAQATNVASGALFGGAIPVPHDAIDDLPTGQFPQGTVIGLATAPSSGTPVNLSAGTTITFFVPGEGAPSRGEYRLLDPLATGVLGTPTVPVLATYAEIRGNSFRTAPATSGTITIDRVTSDGVFGSFRFATDQAVTVDMTQPVDTTDLSDLESEPFTTTIEGSFEAERFEADEDEVPTFRVRR